MSRALTRPRRASLFWSDAGGPSCAWGCGLGSWRCGFVHNADVFLTAAENGDLVLSVARKLPHAPFRVVRLRAFQGSAKVAGTYQAKGKLLAAPFPTERALHLAVLDDGEARFVEAPPSALVPPSGVGIDVAWK